MDDLKMQRTVFGFNPQEELEKMLAVPKITPASAEEPRPPKAGSSYIPGRYGFLRDTSYPHVIEKMKYHHSTGGWFTAQPTFDLSDGTKIPRPLTIEEMVRARVEFASDPNNTDGITKLIEDHDMFHRALATCTGIAYRINSPFFKIIPISIDLITVIPGHPEDTVPVEYDDLKGIELISFKQKCGTDLTTDEILNHDAWNALIPDHNLLKEYVRICKIIRDKVYPDKQDKGLMAFKTLPYNSGPNLRPLVLAGVGTNFEIIGNGGLNTYGEIAVVNKQ